VFSLAIEGNALRKLPLFRELSVDNLRYIGAAMRTRRIAEGELLFAEGERGLGLWFVLEGEVKLVKADSFGREQLLKVVMPQEFFAEVVLFDGGLYPATATAAKDGVVAILYNTDALQLVQDHPLIAWHFLKVLGARLRQAQERVRILSTAHASVRVASILLFLAKERGQDTIELTQQDMADMIGVARETVSRVLSAFAQEGLIALGRKRITILSKERLATQTLQ